MKSSHRRRRQSLVIAALVWAIFMYILTLDIALVSDPSDSVEFPIPALKPFRPLAVRLINLVFRGSQLESFNLSPDSLKREASNRAGGLTDFADDAKNTLEEALRRLSHALETESALAPVGRFLIREQLVMWLENRLRLVALHRQDAHLADRVRKPIFVTGMPRSGTTFLHNLLSQDEENFRIPYHWEIIRPLPRPTSTIERDLRIFVQAMKMGVYRFLAPNFASVHPITATMAEECMPILAVAMLTLQFNTLSNVTSYNDWLMTMDQSEAFRWHRKTLSALTSPEESRRWLLKAPWHLNHLDTIVDTYPDLKIVFTHRDATGMLSSLSSLHARLYGIVSDVVDLKAIGNYQRWQWNVVLERFLSARAKARAKGLDTNFVDLSFKDLTEDPIREVRKIYKFLEMELSPRTVAKMEEWLRQDVALGKKGASGKHEYQNSWYNISEEEVQRTGFYKSYRETFLH